MCPAGARSFYSSSEKLRNRKRSRRPAVVTLSARLASFRPLERVVRGNLTRISGLEKKRKKERKKEKEKVSWLPIALPPAEDPSVADFRIVVDTWYASGNRP